MRSAKDEAEERKANEFFAALYQETARLMSGVEGGAHTGQIPSEIREFRRRSFVMASLQRFSVRRPWS